MMHRVTLNDGEWMAADAVGEGPAVLLVHGIPGSSQVWEEVAERLAPTCRVIRPDLIGFGASSRAERIEELWADRQARALSSLLDSLEVEKAVIVGHDFGGPVVLQMLATHPERAQGLVLAATNVFGDTPIPFHQNHFQQRPPRARRALRAGHRGGQIHHVSHDGRLG